MLNRCLNFNLSKSLFIRYSTINQDFILKLVNQAKSMGINDIYLKAEDPYVTHNILKSISIEEIETHPYFNSHMWDVYVEKNASFLSFESDIPNLMDDISPDKLVKADYIDRATRPLFKKKQGNFEIPWCIAALPNKEWANKIFPNSDNSYEKLFKLIGKMCMLDTEDPIKSWNDHSINEINRVNKLNKLEIQKLHYQNNLGTNFYVELLKNGLWCSTVNVGEDMFPNMPSYEIFTSPNMYKTEGIVYSSKPLIHNGAEIEEFFLEFEDGKVVNYGAKKGKEALRNIIENDEYSCYLGEVALVNYDSPISNTGIVFGETLFDENASCHFALGGGFLGCVKNNKNLNKEELIEMGLNQSTSHVDFMIGTKDLNITAYTKKGKVVIFKDGNFNI